MRRQWGLKMLCQELLNIVIQNDGKGHDYLEDALAAREVGLWCIQRPWELANWGLVKKEEEQQKAEGTARNSPEEEGHWKGLKKKIEESAALPKKTYSAKERRETLR